MKVHAALVVLVGVTAWYAVAWLPRYFGLLHVGQAFLIMAFLLAGLSTVIIWRRETVSLGAAVGFGLLGGLIGVFWPALEVLLQHIDGGGMSLYQNVVYVGAVLSSLAAVVGSAIELVRGQSSRVWLLAATAGTLAAGVFAPDSPPNARRELVLGLPFLMSGTIASWLARARPGL